MWKLTSEREDGNEEVDAADALREVQEHDLHAPHEVRRGLGPLAQAGRQEVEGVEVKCPRCGQEMIRHKAYQKVEVWRCVPCDVNRVNPDHVGSDGKVRSK